MAGISDGSTEPSGPSGQPAPNGTGANEESRRIIRSLLSASDPDWAAVWEKAEALGKEEGCTAEEAIAKRKGLSVEELADELQAHQRYRLEVEHAYVAKHGRPPRWILTSAPRIEDRIKASRAAVKWHESRKLKRDFERDGDFAKWHQSEALARESFWERLIEPAEAAPSSSPAEPALAPDSSVSTPQAPAIAAREQAQTPPAMEVKCVHSKLVEIRGPGVTDAVPLRGWQRTHLFRFVAEARGEFVPIESIETHLVRLQAGIAGAMLKTADASTNRRQRRARHPCRACDDPADVEDAHGWLCAECWLDKYPDALAPEDRPHAAPTPTSSREGSHDVTPARNSLVRALREIRQRLGPGLGRWWDTKGGGARWSPPES